MKRTQTVGKSTASSKTKMKTYNAREARRIATKNGWQLVRVNGSHYIYKHPGCNKILTIPNVLNRMIWERVVVQYDLDLNV